MGLHFRPDVFFICQVDFLFPHGFVFICQIDFCFPRGFVFICQIDFCFPRGFVLFLDLVFISPLVILAVIFSDIFRSGFLNSHFI